MPRPTFNLTVDCDDVEDKRRAVREFAAFVGIATGLYEFDGEARRKSVSNAQHRYYRGVVCKLFWEFLRGQDYSMSIDGKNVPVTPAVAHRLLAKKLLSVPVVHRETGEVLDEQVRSTADLSVEEMHNFIEEARFYLADIFHIACPDPDPFYATALRAASERAES